MITLLHVLIALTSVAWALYILFFPGKTKLFVSYGLMGATLTTGTLLVVASPAHLTHACMTGIVYLAVALSLSLFAKRKLKFVSE